MPSHDNVVLEIPCADRLGEEKYEAELLWEGGRNFGLTPYKIRDLWLESKDYDVLFSDETKGKFKPFFYTLVNPAATWFEVRRRGDDTPRGLVYFTQIIPHFDAQGHFTFWDKIAGGREPFILFLVEWIMDRYSLHRISAQVPPYQAGVIRFIKRLGFEQEGEIREAVNYKGRKFPLILFGMTKDEVDEAIRSLY